MRRRRRYPLADLGRFTEEVILLGVARIVEETAGTVRNDVAGLGKEVRDGFAYSKGSIKDLDGEIAEVNVRDEDQKHEDRLQRLERKVGLRR